MIEIDGSQGEGGGQVVRSSLALAAVTGKPVRIENIRGGRAKPGLLRQHLAGAAAITRVTRGEMVGDELGSRTLQFTPGPIRGGEYRFEIGSAGSAVLVAQTVLPALLFADGPSTVTILGGTHAAMAPPADYFDRCFLPLVARMNGRASVSIQAHGFYPAGGGELTLSVQPTEGLVGLSLLTREGKLRPRVQSLVSKIPVAIAARECDVIRRKTGWPADHFETIEVARSGGPGNVVMIECGFDNVTELLTGFGKVGVRAEQVARQVLRSARAYLAAGVPVGEYLADQILLPMAIAAGAGHASEFRTGPLSQHARTHIDVVKRFVDCRIESRESGGESCPQEGVVVSLGPISLGGK